MMSQNPFVLSEIAPVKSMNVPHEFYCVTRAFTFRLRKMSSPVNEILP